MINAVYRDSNHEKRKKEEQPLDETIKDETLERLIDILQSYGKSDTEIEESLVKDLALSRPHLRRFLKAASTKPSGHEC